MSRTTQKISQPCKEHKLSGWVYGCFKCNPEKPEEKMSLLDDGLVIEQSHNLGGRQRIYRWGRFGLALLNAPMLHLRPFAWEAAVITFKGEDNDRFDLTYSTPLTDDIKIFASEDQANAFIRQVKAYALTHAEGKETP